MEQMQIEDFSSSANIGCWTEYYSDVVDFWSSYDLEMSLSLSLMVKKYSLDGTLNSNKIKTSSINRWSVFSTGEELNILSGAVIDTDGLNKLFGLKTIFREIDDKASTLQVLLQACMIFR